MSVHGWRASAPSCGKLRRARRARRHSSSWCCALVHCGAIGAAFCDCQAAGEWRAARIVRGEARQSRPVRTRSRGTTASSALSMNACARVHLHEGVERACVRACVYARPRLCVRFERCVCRRTCERASYACARTICWVLSVEFMPASRRSNTQLIDASSQYRAPKLLTTLALPPLHSRAWLRQHRTAGLNAYIHRGATALHGHRLAAYGRGPHLRLLQGQRLTLQGT